MNIDEARDRLKEHDALRAFVTQVKTIPPELRGLPDEKLASQTFPVSFEVAQALLPVALWRCNELALAFEEQKSAPATVAPATPAGRPKVKPAVLAEWPASGHMGDDWWKAWAEIKGFKWPSVQNTLRDVRAMPAAERPKSEAKVSEEAFVNAARG